MGNASIVGVIMVYQQLLARALFGSGRRLGEQHISTRCNRNLVWKVRKGYERRMAYLSRPRYREAG